MKKIIPVLLSLVIIIGVFAGMNITVSATYADERWQWTDDGVQQERCTYRVWHEAYERLGISLPTTWGNAGSWASKAAEQGYLVDHNPTANSIVCWGGTGWGHVAYVTSVDSDYVYYRQGGINPSNSNTGYWYNDTKKTISEIEKDTSFKGYIHLRCTTHTWDNGTVTVEPTCKKDGEKTYKCTVCGETKTEKVAKGEKYHKYKVFATVKATIYSNGYLGKRCSICKKEAKSTISRLKTLTLSKNAFVYDGEAKKPAVTVKDASGKTVDAKYYTVTYTNNKTVGLAKVSVKFSGRYQGIKSLTFRIVPKGTGIISVKPFARGFTANWNKQATQTSGYQLKYSTSKDLKSNYKIVTVPGNGTLKKSVEGINSNKAYYVTVRTYKTVNKTKYYSVWSDTVSTKTLTDQVKNLKQTKVTKNSVSLSWDKVSGTKCYQLQLSSNNGKSWKILSSKLTNTSAIAKNLKAGTRYSVRVRALVGSKKIKGAYSNTLKTQTLCIAPTVTLKAKAGAANASWKKVTGAKSYLVYKSTDNKKWEKDGSTTKLSYTLSGLAGETKVYVKVYAVNAYGKKSAASKIKGAKLPAVFMMPKCEQLMSADEYGALVDNGIIGEKVYGYYYFLSSNYYYAHHADSNAETSICRSTSLTGKRTKIVTVKKSEGQIIENFITDGKWIYYVAYNCANGYANSKSTIYKIGTDGKNKQKILTKSDRVNISGCYNNYLYYTHDIIYSDSGEPGEIQFCKFNLKTKKKTVLFKNAWNFGVLEDSNGQYMLFRSYGTGVDNHNIILFDAQTGKKTQVSRGYQAGFSGSKIYYMAYDESVFEQNLHAYIPILYHCDSNGKNKTVVLRNVKYYVSLFGGKNAYFYDYNIEDYSYTYYAFNYKNKTFKKIS